MKEKTMNRFDRLMAAMTFAEADLPDTAREFLQGSQASQMPRRNESKQKADRLVSTHGVATRLLKHS